ncbi:hypothetical protein O7635_07650 [Asanoa sp. WMMD1127]|uniref:hypothetical protein n=1 Tax=Asanoa sp. WMMD1127 TaxID=3016107 RepID=UPI0024164A2E|nr:hypothetical protein [Asanoa sp. WMMD1127]MDG4821726.1 hypothetical protein [Asanoa sp. WMMD1127]
MSRPGSSRCRALSAAAAFGFAIAPVPTPTPTQLDDGSLVFCLDHQDDLVRAAIALDRGTPAEQPELIRVGSRDLQVDEWRRLYPADFTRSCQALRIAGPRPSPAPAVAERPNSTPHPLIAPITTLTATVVGGVLTFLLTRSRDQVALRRQEAQDLQGAAQSFESVVRRYVYGWLEKKKTKDSPSEPQVIERSVELATKLRRVQNARPTWDEPTDLLNQLENEPLGRFLIDTEAWAPLDQADRQRRADLIFSSLANLARDADHIAYLHQRPRQRKPATSETG